MFIKVNCMASEGIVSIWVNCSNLVTIESREYGWELALVPHAKYHYVDVDRKLNPHFGCTLSLLEDCRTNIENVESVCCVQVNDKVSTEPTSSRKRKD